MRPVCFVSKLSSGAGKVSVHGGYNMALRRSFESDDSRAVVVHLLGGDDVQEGVGNPRIIARLEHVAAAAHRCQSRQRHDELGHADDALAASESVSEGFVSSCFRLAGA